MKEKGKFNLDLSMSARDKILLWLLASVLIIVAAYYLGYSKLTDSVNSYEQQLNTAQTKNRQLVQMNADKTRYLEDTENYKKQFNAILAGYDASVKQDAALMYLNSIEEITGAWIKSTTFSSLSPIYTFGKVPSSNPGGAGSSAYQTDMQGYKRTVTLSYEATYKQWKDLVSFLNNYYSKNTIDNISMSYNAENQTVTGTMTLSTYSVVGSSRLFNRLEYSIPLGTDNIFSSASFEPAVKSSYDDDGSYILSDYDYYLLVNAPASDMDSCIVGKKGDDGNSIVSANENAVKEVTVRFAGSNGNYTVSYAVNGKTYPEDDYEAGQSFIPGSTLDFLVISSERLQSEDQNSVNVTFVNETDMDLNVKISNDDAYNPRVSIKKTTGIVNVYR